MRVHFRRRKYIIPAVPWQRPNRSNPCCFDGTRHGSRLFRACRAMDPGNFIAPLPCVPVPCRASANPEFVHDSDTRQRGLRWYIPVVLPMARRRRRPHARRPGVRSMRRCVRRMQRGLSPWKLPSAHAGPTQVQPLEAPPSLPPLFGFKFPHIQVSSPVLYLLGGIGADPTLTATLTPTELGPAQANPGTPHQGVHAAIPATHSWSDECCVHVSSSFSHSAVQLTSARSPHCPLPQRPA